MGFSDGRMNAGVGDLQPSEVKHILAEWKFLGAQNAFIASTKVKV